MPSKSKLRALRCRGNDVVVHVDPGAPALWLSACRFATPRFSAGLAENQGPLGGMVSARIGRRCIVFKLSDGHIDLGALGDDETVQLQLSVTGAGRGDEDQASGRAE